jgi:hypothetical protein
MAPRGSKPEQAPAHDKWWGQLLAYQALLYAFGILILSSLGSGTFGWYSFHTIHREQTAALLRGELALSHSPTQLRHDLLWGQGGVQQPWGLGIPLWRLPFEALARVFGLDPFPDRVALGLFIALGAYGVLVILIKPLLTVPKAGLRPGGVAWISALGAVAIALLFSPLWSVLRCRMVVYEEVLVYTYFCGLLLACSVVWLWRGPCWKRFWWVCAVAGLVGMVRPTLVLYGVATLAVAAWIMIGGEQDSNNPSTSKTLPGWKQSGWWVGILVFAACGGLIWLTNLLRFGSGFEFGHQLNLQAGTLYGSVYATRFDDPFGSEPFLSAARELFGFLFQAEHLNQGTWYDANLFPGQSATLRWRELYLSTYDLSHALLVGLGLLGAWICRPCAADGRRALSEPGIWAWWALGSILLLSGFFLRNPVVSSRYMLDLAPAFAVACVAAWLWMVRLAHRLAGFWILPVLAFALAGWLGWKIGHVTNLFGPPRLITRDQVRLPKPDSFLPTLPSSYTTGEDLQVWGIPYNGTGWDPQSGMVKPSVILFVEDPEELELEVELAEANRDWAKPEQIRAKIDLELLKQTSITPLGNGWRIRFEGPKRDSYRRGLHTLFLACVPKEYLGEPTAPWRLKRVQWRKERIHGSEEHVR